ncbi:MAG: alkaline shock response membrane anchor protein AmaP [Pseudonocardiaceae bacterium]
MTTTVSSAVRKATTRAAGAQRGLVGFIGLLMLAAGATVLVISPGLLGVDRASRPVLDPIALDILRAHQAPARGVAIAVGVVLFVLGLVWAARALKPEHRPNLLLDPSSDSRLEVSASAIAEALRTDAETVAGVSRARVRVVGTSATPVVRLHLWLAEGTDIRDVYHDLDGRVFARARASLGMESLPSAVRMELDTAAAARVS